MVSVNAMADDKSNSMASVNIVADYNESNFMANFITVVDDNKSNSMVSVNRVADENEVNFDVNTVDELDHICVCIS